MRNVHLPFMKHTPLQLQKISTLCVISMLILSAFGCGKKQGSGLVDVEYYPNGKIKAESFYEQDEFHVVMRRYFENGKLESVWRYKFNWLDGPFERYYKNGQLHSQGQYRHNRPVGLIR